MIVNENTVKFLREKKNLFVTSKHHSVGFVSRFSICINTKLHHLYRQFDTKQTVLNKRYGQDK